MVEESLYGRPVTGHHEAMTIADQFDFANHCSTLHALRQAYPAAQAHPLSGGASFRRLLGCSLAAAHQLDRCGSLSVCAPAGCGAEAWLHGGGLTQPLDEKLSDQDVASERT